MLCFQLAVLKEFVFLLDRLLEKKKEKYTMGRLYLIYVRTYASNLLEMDSRM